MASQNISEEGDNLTISINGIAKINGSKLNYDFLQRDSFSGEPPYYYWLIFLEVENRSSRTWEWKSQEWVLSDNEGTHRNSSDLHYSLSKLPEGWQTIQFDIPGNSTVKTVLVYSDLSEGSPWTLRYKKMLAEAWYTSIKQDDVAHITDFTKQYEKFRIKVDQEAQNELRWENYRE